MPHPLLADSTPPFRDPITWAALILAVAATAYTYLRTRMKRRKDPLTKGAPALSLAQQRSVERQMQNLLVELSDMARQVSAQLDNRAAKLELLIREADEKLAALRAATDAPPRTPTHDWQEPLPAHSPSPGAPGESWGEGRRASELSPPQALSPSVPQSLPNPPSSLLSPRPSDSDPRHAAIYLLADQGHSPQNIAAQLDRPKGEIELILALRPNTKRIEERG